VESMSRIGEIKADDKYIIDLNEEGNNVVKDINEFYEGGECVSEGDLKVFNEMCLLDDVKEWLKNGEEENEGWNKNESERELEGMEKDFDRFVREEEKEWGDVDL
uniref:hypothetical protein n=1 Tax=Staphylococcus epidermidis TaxID=1282 RepID=UPI0016433849